MKRGDMAALKFYIYGDASKLGATVRPRTTEPRQTMDVPNTIGPYQAAERIAKLYTDYLTSGEGRERRPFVVVDCGSVSRQVAGEQYGIDRAVYLARIRQRRTRQVLVVLFWLEASQDRAKLDAFIMDAVANTEALNAPTDAPYLEPAEPTPAAPIVEPTAGQTVSRPLKVAYAMLVYQAGIANVFVVDAFTTTPEARNARRIYQGDFRGAELIAIGLATAGTAIRSAGCNMAGDIREREWTFDLTNLPFSDKFNAVHEG